MREKESLRIEVYINREADPELYTQLQRVPKRSRARRLRELAAQRVRDRGVGAFTPGVCVPAASADPGPPASGIDDVAVPAFRSQLASLMRIGQH